MKILVIFAFSSLVSLNLFSEDLSYCIDVSNVGIPKKLSDGSPASKSYHGQVIIDEGGVYSGYQWESWERDKPAVQIRTSECVIIEWTCIKGNTTLIYVDPDIQYKNSKITIRNCKAEGHPYYFPAGTLPPGISGNFQGIDDAGWFFRSFQPQFVNIHNNEIDGTTGINLGMSLNNPALTPLHPYNPQYRITMNRVKNLDGRFYEQGSEHMFLNETFNSLTGSLGYGADSNRVDGDQFGDRYAYFRTNTVNFVRIVGMHERTVNYNGQSLVSTPDIKISWNQVINRPRESSSMDVINMFYTSGTPDKPIVIENNLIWGVYPDGYPVSNVNYGLPIPNCIDPGTNLPCTTFLDVYDNQYFTGSGIMAGDANAPNNNPFQAYDRPHDIIVRNNRIISTGRTGIHVLAGNDIQIYGNRVISSGQGPETMTVGGQTVHRDIEGFADPRPILIYRGGILLENYGAEMPWFFTGDITSSNCPPPQNPFFLEHYKGLGFYDTSNANFDGGIGRGGIAWVDDKGSIYPPPLVCDPTFVSTGDPGYINNVASDNIIWWRRRDYVAASSSNFTVYPSNPHPSLPAQGSPGTFSGPPNNINGFYYTNSWRYATNSTIPNPWPQDPNWEQEYMVKGCILSSPKLCPDPGYNTFWDDEITYDDEINEYEDWLEEVGNNEEITIGVTDSEYEFCPEQSQSRFAKPTTFVAQGLEIEIFPNPSNSYLEFIVYDSKDSPPLQYKIFNSKGTLLAVGLISDENHQISTSHLSQGVYYIEFVGLSESVRKKFIKE